MKKILIIGGTGFLGSSLAKYLKKKNKFDITCTSKSGKKIRNIKTIKFDLENNNDLLKISKLEIDYIVNLGGYIYHNNLSDGGSKVIDQHLIGYLNLLKTLNLKKIKHFIQIGTSDEYGLGKSPQKEEMCTNSFSTYSFSKAASTDFSIMLNKTENFPITVLRPFLIYGNGQDKRRFLPQIITNCLNDIEFPTSKGDQLRDFCHIDDFCNLVFKTLGSKKSFGEIINVGSGKPIKIIDVIKKIQKLIGKGKPLIGKFPYRKMENMSLYADITKAKKILNWKPKVSLDQGIKDLINDITKNN
jgi:nucleoside-diphosphate-sugar epimerase